MDQLDRTSVIVDFQPPQPPDNGQEGAAPDNAPISAAASVQAIERLLRPDLCGIVDDPFRDKQPDFRRRKAAKAAAESRGGDLSSFSLSPNFIRTAGLLAVRGFSEEEIAEAFGVGLAEVNIWEREYPDFKECLSRVKEVQDSAVERSLYNIATGYSHPAVDIKVDKDGIVTRTPYIEHYPPNLGACKEWLHNRQPDRWRPVSPDDGGIGSQAAGAGRQQIQIVLYSPHAERQAVSIQAGQPGDGASASIQAGHPGAGASIQAGREVDFVEAGGHGEGYGPRTRGGYFSPTNSEKIPEE